MRPLALPVIAVVALAATVFAIRGCGEEDARRGATDDEIAGAAPTATSRADAEPDARRERRPRTRTTGQSAAEDDADAPPPAPPEGVTTGTVRDPAGRPVAGAVVALGDIDTEDATTTDALGRFAIDWLWDYERVTAFAVIAGTPHYGASASNSPAWNFDVTVAPLPPTDPFHVVRVVGHDGGAIASARVQLVRGATQSTAWRPPTRTCAGGKFLVRAAEYEDTAEKLAFVVSQATDAVGRALPYGPALVELDPWDDEETVVRLPPGASVIGRAEGPGGLPLADVMVFCTSPPPAAYDADHMTPIWDAGTRTATDGSFRVAGLAPGTAKLRIEPDYPRHCGTTATAVFGAKTPVVLRCDAIAPVRLRVVGEDDLPLGGIEVSESHDTPPLWTLPDGTVGLVPLSPHDFRSPTRTGSASVVIDGKPAHEWVRVEFAPGTTEHTVRLRRVVPIRGVVLGPDGRPAPGVPVAIGHNPASHADWIDGRFVESNIPASESVTLSIQGPGSRWIDATLPAGAPRAEDVILRIPDPGDALCVYVAGARDPLPVAIRHAGTEIGRIDDAEALAHFEVGAGLDRIDVQAGPDSRGRFAFLRDVAARGFLRVELAEGAALSGRVTTTEGHPVPYAAIVVTTASGFRAEAKAQRDGGVRIPGVPAGRVTVSATWRGRRGQVEIDAPSENLALVID